MIPDADELAAIQEELDLATAAIISDSDLDFAYKLQLAEVFKASLANSTFKSESATSSPLRGALAPPAPSSDASVSLMLHADELMLRELGLRDKEACLAALTHDIISAPVTSHDALLARKLDGIPEAQWARHLNKSALPPPSPPILMFKGLTSKQVIGPRDLDPQIAVLVGAISVGQQQEKQVIVHKLLDTFSGSKNLVELKALAESLEAVRPLQSHGVRVITDNNAVHQYMLGARKPNGKKLADMVNQALSWRRHLSNVKSDLLKKAKSAML